MDASNDAPPVVQGALAGAEGTPRSGGGASQAGAGSPTPDAGLPAGVQGEAALAVQAADAYRARARAAIAAHVEFCAQPDALAPAHTFGTNYRRSLKLLAALIQFKCSEFNTLMATASAIAARSTILKQTSDGSLGRAFWMSRLDAVAAWLRAGVAEDYFTLPAYRSGSRAIDQALSGGTLMALAQSYEALFRHNGAARTAIRAPDSVDTDVEELTENPFDDMGQIVTRDVAQAAEGALADALAELDNLTTAQQADNARRRDGGSPHPPRSDGPPDGPTGGHGGAGAQRSLSPLAAVDQPALAGRLGGFGPPSSHDSLSTISLFDHNSRGSPRPGASRFGFDSLDATGTESATRVQAPGPRAQLYAGSQALSLFEEATHIEALYALFNQRNVAAASEKSGEALLTHERRQAIRTYDKKKLQAILASLSFAIHPRAMEAIAKDELWDFSSLNAFEHQPAPDPVAVAGLPDVFTAGKLPTKPFENGLQWARCFDIYVEYRSFWYPWELDGLRAFAAWFLARISQSPSLFANYLAFFNDVFQKVGVPGYPQTLAASINDVPLLLFHLNRPARAPSGKAAPGSSKQTGQPGSAGSTRAKELCNRWNDRDDDHVCGRAHSCVECGSAEHGKHDCPALGGVGKDKRRKPRGRTEGASGLAARK